MTRRRSIRSLLTRVFWRAVILDGLLVAAAALIVSHHQRTGDSDLTPLLLVFAAGPTSLALMWSSASPLSSMIGHVMGGLPELVHLVLVLGLCVAVNAALVTAIVGVIAGAIAGAARGLRRS